MADEKTLVFRFRFSPDDDRFAYAASNRRLKLRALGRLAVALLIGGVAIYGLVAEDLSGAGFWAFVFITLVLASATGDVLASLDTVFFGGERVDEFDEMEIESAFDQDGLSNKTPYIEQHSKWEAVKDIAVCPYGISVQTVGPDWYIPRSAFPSELEMHMAYKRIIALQKNRDNTA